MVCEVWVAYEVWEVWVVWVVLEVWVVGVVRDWVVRANCLKFFLSISDHAAGGW